MYHSSVRSLVIKVAPVVGRGWWGHELALSPQPKIHGARLSAHDLIAFRHSLDTSLLPKRRVGGDQFEHGPVQVTPIERLHPLKLLSAGLCQYMLHGHHEFFLGRRHRLSPGS